MLFSQCRSCDNILESCFIPPVGTIYENTFGQIRIRPSLGKPNIQAEEVYCLDRSIYRPKNPSELDDPDNYMPESLVSLGHFRVAPTLSFKARLSAKPLI